MAKSMVEKYEQILSADPGSMVFVELAKALLDRGDSKRAIDICTAGLQHHPESVVGRVLWGKALINSGRAVEAMSQFDQAIAIDRENPYAYNLIGEVLLHKGLHRSALPILKKAVALQPTDGRVRQWLDQTTRALNGEKPSAKPDYTHVDPPTDNQATVPGRPSLPSLLAASAEAANGAAARPPSNGATAVGPSPSTAAASTGGALLVGGVTDTYQALSARPDTGPNPAAAPAAAPVEPAPAEARSDGIVDGTLATTGPHPILPSPTAAEGGLASESPPSSDSPRAPGVDIPASAAAESTPPAPAAEEPPAMPAERGSELTLPAPPPPSAAPETQPVSVPAVESEPALSTHPGVAPPAPSLLSTLPDLGSDVPATRDPNETVPLPIDPPKPAPKPVGGPPPLSSRPRMAAAPAGPPPLAHKPKGPSMLSDLPELSLPGVNSSLVLPKIELSTQAAEDIAKQYEQELRAKLAAAENKPPTFWSKHGLKIGGAVVVVLASGVGIGVFRYQKRANTNVPESMARARTGLEKDTVPSYQAALVEVADVEAAKPDEAQAPALAAYAHAVLYREHGGAPADREEALKSLGREDVTAKYPDLAAAARYYLADSDAERQAASQAVLDATAGGAEVHEIAGRLRLASDARKALEQLQESLKAQPNHVRSYVVLGDYYLEKGEPARAVEMFTQAKGISEHHPSVLLGLAQARLAEGQNLDESRAEIAPLEKDPSLSNDDRSRWALVSGRLLAEAGKTDEAQKRLEAGLAHDPSRAVEFHQALAELYLVRGEGDHAFNELAAALKERPHDTALMEASARAAIGFGRPQDALKLTEGTDDRRLHLVRGLAQFDLGDYEAAKKELLATRRDKGMPSEAAVALARVDIATGHKDEAREALGAIAKAGKLSPRASLAQGELALADGDREAAKKAFAAAAEDPHEASASLALGRILFAEGKLTAAQAALSQAVERNRFLAPAQLLLAHVQLDLGMPASALGHLQGYVKEHRDDPVALGLVARIALFRNDLVEARRSSDLALSHAGKDAAEAQWTHEQIALAAGDGSTALREIEKRAKGGRGAEGWLDLGDALLDLDDPHDAGTAYAKALKAERQNVRAQVAQAIAEAGHGAKSNRALEAFGDAAARLSPVLQAKVLAAVSRLKTGDAARDLAQKAVAADEACASAQLALGVALGGADDPTVAALSKAVAQEPASAEAHIALAEALGTKGGKDELQRSDGEAEVARRINPHGPSADRAKRLLASNAKRRGK